MVGDCGGGRGRGALDYLEGRGVGRDRCKGKRCEVLDILLFGPTEAA